LYNAGGNGGVVEYTKESILYKGADEKLFCSKWNVIYDTATDTYVVDSTVYTDQLLAENVTDFQVDLSDTFKDTAKDGSEIDIVKSVQIAVEYEDGTGKADYATSPVITLRNRMMRSSNPTKVFDETPDETDTMTLYISETDMAAAVPIQDGLTEVTRGELYNIYAMINGGANVNNLVDWEIEETNSLSTIDSSGKLNVGQYEPCAYLTITAKYKSNPTKKATGVVKVVGGAGGGILKSLKSVSIITKSLMPFQPKYSSAVVAEGFTAEDYSKLVYKWEVMDTEMKVSDKVEPYTDSGTNLELKIKQSPLSYGKTLNIRLTVTSPTTGQSVSDNITYRIDEDRTTGGDSNMERGRVGNIVYLSYRWGEWSDNWETEFYFCDEFGNYISELDPLKQYIKVNHHVAGFGFDIEEGLPADREYYVKVIVKVYPNSGNNWDYERIIYIPAVQIYGKTTFDTRKSAYDSYTLNFGMSGYYGAAWQSSQPYELEVVDLQYDAPDGIELTPTFSTSYWIGDGGNDLGVTVGFNCNGDKNGIVLKSMKVKVTFKEQPDIYAYSTILFGQN